MYLLVLNSLYKYYLQYFIFFVLRKNHIIRNSNDFGIIFKIILIIFCPFKYFNYFYIPDSMAYLVRPLLHVPARVLQYTTLHKYRPLRGPCQEQH
jgi:hypothetical protein